MQRILQVLVGLCVLVVVGGLSAMSMPASGPPAHVRPAARPLALEPSFPHISHELGDPDGFSDQMEDVGNQFERRIAELEGRTVDTGQPAPSEPHRVPGAFYPEDVASTDPPHTPTVVPALLVALTGGGLVFGVVFGGGFLTLRLLRPDPEHEVPDGP